MIKITENNNTNISYTIQHYKENEIILKNEIKCKSKRIIYNNFSYYVLFDETLNIITDVFDYLNVYMKNRADQSKEQAIVALKYLYSFCAIFSIEPNDMSINECSSFLIFLLGLSIDGIDISFEFNSTRSIISVNKYLSCIHSFLNYLKLYNHPLLERKKINNYSDVYSYNNSYKLKLKCPKRKYVPKYINQEEFLKTLKYCQEINHLRLECVIRLMYESGLRIGEVLGLTLEDVVQENNISKIILRNRLTDKTYQKAKFLMTIKDINEYNSTDYKRKGYGWDEMPISNYTYEKIMDYIEIAHTNAQEKNYDSWLKNMKTQSVSSNFQEEHNFYIFINNHNKPLSNKTLESEIKAMFLSCNIPLSNDGGKSDGLAHRFRHGFAMYQVNNNNLDRLQLSKMLRHKNLNSCEIYYNPEITEIINIKNNISESVYNLLPRFNIHDK